MADADASWPRQSGTPVRATVAGTRLELIETGAARLDAILDLIAGAKSSLRILFYMFNSDETGTRVRDALVAAAERGVKVRVLLDGFGCGSAEPDFFKALEADGSGFCIFHPSYGRRYLVRNHQKLAVADEKRAIIGGSNIHDAYFADEGPKHWRDLWLAVEGPAVPAAAAYFDAVYRWTRNKGAKLRQLRALVRHHSQFRGPIQWKFSSPLSTRNPWPFGVGRELNNAMRLDMISAYFSPPRAMLRRIARIGVRGRARIITAAQSDNATTIGAARHTYRRLLKRGVEMYEYQPARLHTKLVLVDDAVHIGSSNFDFRSLYINLEIMLRVGDAGFAAQMRGYFERELRDSKRITPALHKQRGTLWRRLKWAVSNFLVTTMDYTVTRRLNFRPDG
jgi:cardiolipin synthase